MALVWAGPLGGIALAYGFPLVAALYAGAGLLAWWRRPANRLGPQLVGGGAAFLCVSLANTDVPALIAAGTVTATVPVAVVVHLLHTFPGGRLRGRASTAAVLAIYVVALVLQIPIWAFTPEPPPFDVVLVSPRPDLAEAGAYVQQVCGAVVVMVTVGLLVRRLSEYDFGQRRVLAPVLAYGVLAVLAIPLGGRLLRQLGLGDDAVWIQLGLLAGVPVVFAAVVLRGGFAPTRELSAFVTSVASSSGSRDELEQAVATTLGDPSATLLHRSPATWTPPARSSRCPRPTRTARRSASRSGTARSARSSTIRGSTTTPRRWPRWAGLRRSPWTGSAWRTRCRRAGGLCARRRRGC